MAGAYHGHLLEFPLIRVDCFTTPRSQVAIPPWRDTRAPPVPAPQARLYLLTHVHTDHLNGLSNNFTGKIVCSPETKKLLLQLEEEKSHINVSKGNTEIGRRKYSGLQDNPPVVPISRPYGEPKEYNLGYQDGKEVKVTVTLFDANHCPGSTMFLISSPDAVVLHTGDLRADDQFLSNLRHNPHFQPYLATPDTTLPPPENSRRLDRIYIDTSAILYTDVPQKTPVVEALVRMIDNYPSGMGFFFNLRTLGWEYLVKAVAQHFKTKVHVDKYKRRLYEASEDQELVDSTTLDSQATRFHACERFNMCEHCRPSKDRLVVRVIMAEYDLVPWDLRSENAFHLPNNDPYEDGSWFDTLSVPLARHSTLPELKRLVALFNPTALSPNDVPPATANINNTVRRQKLIQALGWIRGNNFPSLVTNLSNNGSAPGAQTLGASSSQPYANSTSNDVHDRHADKSSSPPRKRARQNSSFRLDTLHFKSLTDIPK